jgi:putative membrane protein
MIQNKLLIFCLTESALLSSCNNNMGNKDESSTDSATAINEQREENDANKVTKEDAVFVVMAADAGLAQVEFGKLALTKAISPKVKAFAQMIITDYAEHNKNLRTLAGSKNITVPATISETYKDKLDDLNDENEKDFEQDFLEKILEENQKTIAYYKEASTKANDMDIRSYAAKVLPDLTLQKERTEMVTRSMKK